MRRFDNERYRVIQWATGNQGRMQLGMVGSRQRPHLELAGCWVHSAEKVGVDAGELAEIGPLGVKATSDIDALLELDADCILYSPFFSETDLICRMLRAGKNVITQIGDVFIRDGDRHAQITAACDEGGTTFFGTGINTGFFSDRLCASLTTLCGEVEHIRCIEYSHNSLARLSPFMIFEAMGFGWSEERLATEEPALFSSGLHDEAILAGGDFVAAALGFDIDRRETDHRYGFAHRDIERYGGVARKGTVGAVSPSFRMYDGDTERLEFTQAWKIDPDVPTDWGYDSRPRSFYRIRVTGKPCFDVYWEPEDDGMAVALYSTAAAMVNAIPFVCDAPPGIRTQIDLPMICFNGELSASRPD